MSTWLASKDVFSGAAISRRTTGGVRQNFNADMSQMQVSMAERYHVEAPRGAAILRVVLVCRCTLFRNVDLCLI